ncbi:DUF4393 domain-containing protein [Mucilaginibacter sp. AW1-3]
MSEGSVKSVAEILGSVVKPMYDDAVQPAAKQVGRTLETVTKTVNMALMPIKVLVWGYEQIESWLTSRLAEKLRNVPDEHIVTPAPAIAGPAIEALRYAGYDEHLRELYANLLAAAMDSDTVAQAHPGYVEVLKNLSSEEAILLRAFIHTASYPAVHIKSVAAHDGSHSIAKRYHATFAQVITLQHAELIPSYLDNLLRLGILESPGQVRASDSTSYELLETGKDLEAVFTEILHQGRHVEFERIVIRLTNFGGQFVQKVVKEKA